MKKTLPDNTSAATPGISPPQGAAAIGHRLKKARQASNADLKNLAARLKVPESKLIAMEEGTLAMPHLIFLRGMLRSYAKILGIDINAELAELGAPEEETVAAPEKPKNTIAAPSETAQKAAIGSHEKAKKTPITTRKRAEKEFLAVREQNTPAASEGALPPQPNARLRTHKLLLWLMLGIFISSSAIYLIAQQVKNNHDDDVTPSTIIDIAEAPPVTPSSKSAEIDASLNLSAPSPAARQKPEAQLSAQLAPPHNKTKGRNPAANPRVLSLSNHNQTSFGPANTDTTIVDDNIIKPITTTSPSVYLPETETPTIIDKVRANPSSAHSAEAVTPAITDKAPTDASSHRSPEAATPTPTPIDKTPVAPSKAPTNPSAPNKSKEEVSLLNSKLQSDSNMARPTIDNMMLNRLTSTVVAPRSKSRTTNEKPLTYALKSPPTTQSVNEKQPLTHALKSLAVTQPLLSIKFNGKSWYAVSDANGKVLASGAGQPGDVQQIRGTAPIKIALGNTLSVEAIEFRGRHVELEKTQSGVARLNLK